jgi:hypothetical protein
MTTPVHIAVRRFEIVIVALDVCFCLLVLFYLWHRAWIVAVVMLVFAVLIGVIGQALPHRKHQTGNELAQGGPLDVCDGRLSSGDARGLGTAAFKTAALLAVATFVVGLHSGWRWFWAVVAAAFSYLILLVGVLQLISIPKKKKE